MKIGILTLGQETNYGGILQSFALQTVLRRMGYEVYTIDRHNRRQYPSLKANILGFGKRLKEYYIEHKRVSTCWDPHMSNDVYRIISANTRDFVSRNMQMTRECWSDELAQIEEEYKFDAYVVGSDQVWLPGYYPSSFLDFVTRPGVIKVTYAASCGKVSFINNPKFNKEYAQGLISQFSGISVRELSLQKLCKDNLDIEVEHVLDPTLLLNPEDYLSVCRNNVGDDPIVFSYILDGSSEKQSLVHQVSNELGLPVVAVNAPRGYIKRKDTDVNECIFPPIDDWVRNLYRAKFVVTDSFHGTALSILFNKPFVVVGNAWRGMARFESLLGMFGLENRMILKYEEKQVTALVSNIINYEDVRQRLESMRDKSMLFLKKSLIYEN